MFIILNSVCAMSQSSEMEPISFEEVIQQEGRTKKEIYNDLRNWFARTFVDSNEVIQYNDENSEITGKGSFKVKIANLTFAAGSGYVSYVVNVRIREGRFKVVIDNFVHHSTDLTYSDSWSIGLIYKSLPEDLNKVPGCKGLAKVQYKGVFKRVQPMCIEQGQSLINSLKAYLQTSKKVEDDW